jgi:hypothetical protein
LQKKLNPYYFILLFSALYLFVPNSLLFGDSTLISFKLKDQFDNEYTENDFLGGISLLIGSDKEGSKYNQLWGGAIRDSLNELGKTDQVKIIPLADLRGVPFFLKGFIKGKFPKESDQWVILDWRGHFPKAYDLVPHKTNILIFDPNGTLVYFTNGEEPDLESIGLILLKLTTLFPKD